MARIARVWLLYSGPTERPAGNGGGPFHARRGRERGEKVEDGQVVRLHGHLIGGACRLLLNVLHTPFLVFLLSCYTK